jgi:hypothetical protein
VEAVCTITLFVFDEGISNAQQAKIISLEIRIAPRNLSPSQQKEIADALRVFSGTQFITGVYPSDAEGRRLEEQLRTALISAGFKFLQHNRNAPPESLITDVHVSSNKAGKPISDAVCTALKAKDIECKPDSEGNPLWTANTLSIWVGVKAVADP